METIVAEGIRIEKRKSGFNLGILYNSDRAAFLRNRYDYDKMVCANINTGWACMTGYTTKALCRRKSARRKRSYYMSDLEKKKSTEEQEENKNVLDLDKEETETESKSAEDASGEVSETESSNSPDEAEDASLPEQEDLEFITHESVRDKSKMAEGEVIEDEMLSRKKTRRRSVDAEAAKVEKVQKIAKKNLHFIIIGAVVIIVAICLLVFGVRRVMDKRAEENSEQPLSAQEYEKNENEQVNELITSYYTCYADGDTDSILQYAYPMSDDEKSYIQMYSEYVEEYQDITCYTKTGSEDGSYVVSVTFNVKYQDVDTVAPGMDFFYVRTDDNGELYMDNTYSPFNLTYQEYTLDQTVVQMIQDYQTGDDVIALQNSVQTDYDQALQADAALKTMVEETLANAVNTWTAEREAAQQKAEEEAQQQVQQEQQAQEQQNQQAQDQQNQSQQAQEQQTQNQGQQADAVTETENRAWVYVNDTVNIRQQPNESSAVLASAARGAQVRQIAVTSNGWVRVRTGDIEGYIRADYISAQPVG